QLLPGPGRVIGNALTGDPRIAGTCFTGSTATAQAINRNMAAHCAPHAMLIAETGGINAMIVDSTALPEQAVRDILSSAFQSAGQRCSALRLLYVQRDIADSLKDMLFGAMDALSLGDPWWLANDVGPVIDPAARAKIVAHIDAARAGGCLLKQLDVPDTGFFVGPAAIAVGGIEGLAEEIFGPVLHIATFEAGEIDGLVDRINARGYGLTFGLQTRIDKRVDSITARIRAGNAYVNRNQIGAVVGTQPFGGEGLSGTGPKAGGPHYLKRFAAAVGPQIALPPLNRLAGKVEVEMAFAALPQVTELPLETREMPGPTGESNVLSLYPRGVVLCLGPTPDAAAEQAQIARSKGCAALMVVPRAAGPHSVDGFIERADLAEIEGFDAVALWSEEGDQRAVRAALAKRNGPILPLFTEHDFGGRCVHERHVCIDTTAAGGNVTLLA
ncbi:aldehyde dehydrogenase family protein, partial [Blastomonas sp.]|uniref:aldehyde dehydrogenase family protein n=1 Tax=Blastomonas sp. TaxID=1909299 RepID=UPI0035942014